MSEHADHYNNSYGGFASDLSAAIRREAYGEDIGQNSWTTADEQRGFAEKSGLGPQTHLLELGCGTGGPALFLAKSFGLTVTGIDINLAGITVANLSTSAAGLTDQASFLCADGADRLPFADQSFDAVQLTDAINHFADRPALLSELHRVLRPGGTLLYTDPVVISGAISATEIAARSSIGYFVFVPPGENERMLVRAGFAIVAVEDVTAAASLISGKRHAARNRRQADLTEIEGPKAFAAGQDFLRMVCRLYTERRLSRYSFLARRG